MYALLATGIALSIAILTESIRIIDFLFYFFIEIKFWKLLLLTPIFVLLLNVILDLKLNPLLIDLCFFLSKLLINALYAFAGFLAASLLANLFFGHMNYISFFAITGFTTYFLSLATHWIVLDLESQSRDLCSETYC